MESKVCHQCGSVNDATGRFCYRCGATLNGDAAVPSESPRDEGEYGGATYDFGRTEPAYRRPPLEDNAAARYYADDDNRRDRPRSLLLPSIVALGGVVVGLLVVVLLIRALGGGPGDESPTPSPVAKPPVSPTESSPSPTETATPEESPPPIRTPSPTPGPLGRLEGYVWAEYGACDESHPDVSEEGAIASITCDPPAPVGIVYFDLFPDGERGRELMDQAFSRFASTLSGGENCRSRAFSGTWEIGGTARGDMKCFVNTSDEAVIVWTDWEIHVLAYMQRFATDINPLVDFWEDNALLDY